MSAEDTIQPKFYSVWPNLGKKFSKQLGEIRTDTSSLAPMVRGIGLDAAGDWSDLDGIAANSVQAYEIGQQDFHNRFRIHYNKDDDLFEIASNTGTEEVPQWYTTWWIDNDGNVTQQNTPTTASNVGGGAGVFKQKVGVDLEFKSLTATSPITLTDGASTIDVDGSALVSTYSSDQAAAPSGDANVGVEIILSDTGKVGNDLPFKAIKAGPNVVVTNTGTAIQIESTAQVVEFYGIAVGHDDGSQVYPEVHNFLVNRTDFYVTQQKSSPSAKTIILNSISDPFNSTDYVAIIGDDMTGPLAQADGSAALPSYTFTDDTSMGLSRNAADDLGVSIAGAFHSRFLSDRLLTQQLQITNSGSAAAPDLYFFPDSDTGIFQQGLDSIAFATGGVRAGWFSPNQDFYVTNRVLAGSGDDPLHPGYGFGGTPGMGMYDEGSGVLAFANEGVRAAYFNTNQSLVVTYGIGTGGTIASGGRLTSTTDITSGTFIKAGTIFNAPDGTANSPTYTFDSDSNTGLYRSGANQIGFSINQTKEAYVAADGIHVTNDVFVDDEVYGVGWDGSLEVPTKNAVYDKIELIAGGGEVNTASNLPGDEGIYFQKVVSDLEFKSLTAGSNITLSSDNDTITITGAAGAGGGGFYGVIFRESETGGAVMRDDTLVVDSKHFYLSGSTDGKPLLSLQGDQTLSNLSITDGGRILADAGTAAAPAYAFTEGTATGFRINPVSPEFLHMIADGVVTSVWGSSYIRMYKTVRLDDSGAPSDANLVWQSDLNTGLWHDIANGVEAATPLNSNFQAADNFHAVTGGIVATSWDENQDFWVHNDLYVTKDVKAGRVEAGIGNFYVGVITVKESESGGASFFDNTVAFDSTRFYVSSGGDHNPLVSLNDSVITTDVYEGIANLNKLNDGGLAADERIGMQVGSGSGLVHFYIQNTRAGKNRRDPLDIQIDGQNYTYTPEDPALVIDAAGSDISPVQNFIWWELSGGAPILNKSTTDWPSNTPHARIATTVQQTAATIEADGPLKLHAWTDHVSEPPGVGDGERGSRGHLHTIGERLRSFPATWKTGVALTVDNSPGTNLYVSTTVGTGYQMHRHVIPACDSEVSNPIWVPNDAGTPYRKVSILDAIVNYSDASPIGNNDYYTLVLWMVVSENEEDTKFFINTPTGGYTTQSSAETDASGKTVYNIPDAYIGTAILLYELVMKVSAGASWEVIKTVDLRGVPGVSVGGGGTAASGEANTASNIGSGAGVFSAKVAEDLQFKSLKGQDTTVSVTSDSDEVFFSATGTFYTPVSIEGTEAQLTVGDGNAGDSIVTFYDEESLVYTAGFDTSASAWKIAGGIFDGTNDEIVVTEGRTVFSGDVVSGRVESGIGNFYIYSDIGTLHFTNSFITDSDGAISFDDENLSTTGTLAAGSTTITGTIVQSLGTQNVIIGEGAGTGGLGQDSVFIGYNAGTANTAAGDRNLFIGSGAGDSTTSGVDNICIGYNAGAGNVTGNFSIRIGNSAGLVSTSSNSTYIGYEAGKAVGNESRNTFIGYQSGLSDTTGDYNTFIGHRTALLSTTGSFNTVVGANAGTSMAIAAGSNTLIGYNTGSGTTTGDSNTYLGHSAGLDNDTGNSNVCIGQTSGGGVGASFNQATIIGSGAGGSLTSGANNLLFGYNAGIDLTEGDDNILFIGGDNITTGDQNVAIGRGSFVSMTTTSNNVGIGFRSGRYSSGGENTFIGVSAGSGDAGGHSGDNNVSIGYQSGLNLTGVAQQNTFLGTIAGYGTTTGDSNVYIGYWAGRYQTTESDQLIIDNRNQSNKAAELTDALIVGNFHGTPSSQTIKFNANTTVTYSLIGTPDEITAAVGGVAASVATLNTEVTTDGDAGAHDDNVTLANGTSGQVKNIYCVVEGNAADTWKITPATMVGGTQITFAGAGEGCTLVYADNEGWTVTGNNGGTIT